MNGQYQETRGPGRQIPEERKQHIMVLLARMIHQRLTASRTNNPEGAARKGCEREGHLRAPLMR